METQDRLEDTYPNLLRAITLVKIFGIIWLVLMILIIGIGDLVVLIGALQQGGEDALIALGGAAVGNVVALVGLVFWYIFYNAVPEFISLFVSMEAGINHIADRA